MRDGSGAPRGPAGQLDIFGESTLPPGLRHQADVVPPGMERALLEGFVALDFAAFAFHGHLGNRRVVSFGWGYDFEREALREAPAIPPLLLPLREHAAAFAGLAPEALSQVLVTEYVPGAGIGWHRDKAVFGDVVGVSLGAPCLLRLRRRAAGGWQRASLRLEPRSAYLLSGPSRTEWEHSIPPMQRLRHSVTFRTLRGA